MPDQLSSDLAALRIDRAAARPPRGGRLRLVVILAIVGAAIAAVVLVGLPMLRARIFKTEVTLTEISLVSPAQAEVNLTATGYVVPETISTVAAKVAGRVADVKVKQGDSVEKGQVLLELDRTTQESNLRAARARAAAAAAAAQTARAQVVEAENQARLARNMAKQGVGAESTAVDAEARVASLQAAVHAADAQAHAVQQEVAALEVDLENYTVLAPIGGKILNKPPELGEMVGPAFGGVASELGGVELADFDSLVAQVDVPEPKLGSIQPGNPCEVVLDAFPTQRWRCKVKEIVPKVDRSKATVPVKVSFVDKPPGALPDMAARVSFLSKELDAAAMKAPPKKVVPRTAVAHRGGSPVVFTLQEGQVRMVPIALGPEFGDSYELVRGPDPGTKVVANPSDKLSDGQKVKEKTD